MTDWPQPPKVPVPFPPEFEKYLRKDTMPPFRRDRRLEKLPTRLDQFGRMQYAERLASAEAKYREVEDEKAKVASSFNDSLKKLREDMKEFGAAVREGVANVETDIEITRDYGAGTITTVRIDTGEVLSEGKMSQEEQASGLQANMEFKA